MTTPTTNMTELTNSVLILATSTIKEQRERIEELEEALEKVVDICADSDSALDLSLRMDGIIQELRALLLNNKEKQP